MKPFADAQVATNTVPAGALDLWRAELTAGVRTLATTDALLLAACAEANGIEAKRQELHLTASAWFAKAARIVLDAAAERARSRSGVA